MQMAINVENIIQIIFTLEESELIRSILLSSQNRKDKQVWHYTKNEIFFIKSAYYLHIDLQNIIGSGLSSQ